MSTWRKRLKKSSSALVDTSALLALGAPRDQYHDRAVAIAQRWGGRLVGTTLVLAEFHGLALQRQGTAVARTAVDRLLGDPAYEWLDVSAELARDAVQAWLERFGDQRFSLTDAVSFEVMRREKIEAAFAFDRHFVTAGFELLR